MKRGLAVAAIPALAFAYLLSLAPAVSDGAVLRATVPWLSAAGIDLAFSLDGLSLVFALLITGLGAFVVAYAWAYLADDPKRSRFIAVLLAFMGAMLGLVLADDVIALFAFWELTGVCSFLLVGHAHHREAARQAARQALVVTAVGGLALLAGLLMLATAAGGTYSLSAIVDQADRVRAHPLYVPAFALIAVGAFTKSAQFPFHFWLPNAMAAPTPASAYLHSATMVKAGIYLLARTDQALGDTAVWTWTLVGVGSVTMLLGAVQALRETDLKRVLAYSTITALGTLVVLLGTSFDASVKAVVVFVAVHALYKCALFMIVGIVDKVAGTRDVTRLTGLARAVPWLGAAAAIAGLSMAGLPPMFGFIGKELTYKAKLGFEAGGWLLPLIAVVANALTVAAAAILVLRPFFGRAREPVARVSVGAALGASPVVLAVACMAFGAFPHLIEPLVAAAASSIVGRAIPVEVSLWYGAGPALFLSVVTVVAGGASYVAWRQWRVDGAGARSAGLGARVFEATVAGVARCAARVAGGLERIGATGIAGLAFALVVAGAVAGASEGVPMPDRVGAVWLSDIVLGGVAVVGAVVAVRARSRMTMLVAVGAVGVAVSVWFVSLGAIDLAMTQLLVETVVVVVALGALRVAPRAVTRSASRRRRWPVVVATLAGAAMTMLALGIVAGPVASPASDYYIAASAAEAHGRNVVNTILVDFRALDTLGEIAVLVLALVAARAIARPPGEGRASGAGPSLVAGTAARAFVPLLAIYGGFLLVRGHNAPGGGFIAGLVIVVAALVSELAGRRAALARLRPIRIAVAGLGVAMLASILSLFAGGTYFEGVWGEVAGVAVGTPLLFDLGVFGVVVGVGIGATSGSLEVRTCS